MKQRRNCAFDVSNIEIGTSDIESERREEHIFNRDCSTANGQNARIRPVASLRQRKTELTSEIAISGDVYSIAPSILSFPRYFTRRRTVVREVKNREGSPPPNEIKIDSRN